MSASGLSRSERQDGEPENRPRVHDLAAVDHGQGGAQIGGERLGRRIPLGRRLGQRAVEHPISGGHGRRDRSGPAACRTSRRAASRRQRRAMKGGRPASISKATTAAENKSDRASTAAPVSCSGEAYCGVPTNIPAAVSGWPVTSPGACSGRARPKSRSFTPVALEEDVRRLQVAVHDAVAVQHGERIEDGDGRAQGLGRRAARPRARRSASDSAATSSIAMNGRPSASPRS